MEEQIFVRQREEDDLYYHLSDSSLERLQGLARELWTDYNVHDPGVTIMNVLNYSLTELDYRLRFDLLDYLANLRGQDFSQQEYGLFSPLEVFPIRPLTLLDYRKLMIDKIREIEDIWIYPKNGAGDDGWYEALVEMKPGARRCCEEQVEKQVMEIYNGNRNLCEGLKGVSFVKRKPLVLSGVIDVERNADIGELLVAIYWEALQFFVPGVCYRKVEELIREGKTLDELLDGPKLNYWVIDNSSLKPLPMEYSVPVFYHRLIALKGIKNIRSLAFLDGEKIYDKTIRAETPEESYTVRVPEHSYDSCLELLLDNNKVNLDFSQLSQQLYSWLAESYGNQNQTIDLVPFMDFQHPVLRDIYTHESVQNDFPECYAVGRMGVATDDTLKRKAQAMQLKAFLLLFDQNFARAAGELCSIQHFARLNQRPRKTGIVKMDAPEIGWEHLVKKETWKQAEDPHFLWEKKKWLDMLDRIYGEDSYPAWLNVVNYYDSNEDDVLAQRSHFLEKVPNWGAERAKGCDLTSNSPGNIPGIKAYVAFLLGFEITDERPVVNVFPLYNLQLVNDDCFYNNRGHILGHYLLQEEMLREEYMERIPIVEKEFSDMDYHVLRDMLPLFRHNLLFEGLFRGGIKNENYRLLNLPNHPDRLLIFYHQQRKQWINLGRFILKNELIETANCLRRFLEMLNRRCETMYVVEHIHLFANSGDFFYDGDWYDLTIVFPGWSVRMADPSFRGACEALVCMRLPAHLKMQFQWFPLNKMWEFEQAYFDWRKALVSGDELEKKAEELRKVLQL